MGQLGQTSLAVVPTMKGLRSKVNAEAKAAAKLAGRSMSDEFGKSADESSRQFGRAFKQGSADAQYALKETTRANAQATAAWSKANRDHENAVGQVRVAQSKLNETMAKYGAESSQVISAQERLATAQRRVEQTSVQLTNAQGRLTEATSAMKAAQDAVNGSAATGSSVWARMAKDLEPVSSRINAVVNRVREWGGSSKLLQPFRTVLNNIGSSLAVAALKSYNFADGLISKVGGAAKSVASTVSSTFNGFLMNHPALNVAVTKIGDGFRKVGETIKSTGSMLGGLGKAAMTGASAIGSALGSGLSSTWTFLHGQLSNAATAFTNVLGGAAIAAGAAITVAMKKALTGGFSRLSNIELAQAKMRGLGFSGDAIKSAMAGATDAVEGTAFALDEMATAAAMAMAAGKKPGEELNAYMKILKNTAAAANAPLDDMARILNKTVTAGRAYTREITQIAAHGLPIWEKLQEAYGVSAKELRDMVADGKVDSETFMKVMNEMTGSVADEMGKTVPAAIAIARTAMNKLGADILSGLYPVLYPLFIAIKAGAQMLQVLGAPAFKALGDALAPVGEKLTAFYTKWQELKPRIGADGLQPITAVILAFKELGLNLEGPIGLLRTLSDTWKSLGDAVLPVIGALVGSLGPLLARLPLVGGAFAGIKGPLGMLIGLFIAMWNQSEELRKAVGTVFEALMGAAKTILPALLPVFTAVADIINKVAGVLGDVLGAALVLIVPLIEPLTSVLMTVINAVMPMLPMVSQFAQLLGGILVTALTALNPLFVFLGDLMVKENPIIEKVAAVVMRLLEALMPILEPIGELIATLLPPLIDLFMRVHGPVMDLAILILNSLLPVIDSLVTMLDGLIQFVVGVFTGNWEQAWNGIKKFFGGFVDAIANLVKGIGKIIGGIYDTIMDVLGGIGGWLVDSGKALIQGFLDGITTGFKWVGDKISGALDWIGGFFPHSPAKRGPLSGAGWRALRQSGEAYADQWIGGIEDGMKDFNVDAALAAPAEVAGTLSASVLGGASSADPGVSEAPAVFELYDADGKLWASMTGIAKRAVEPISKRRAKQVLGVNA